jgi:hypothetical protein
VRTARIARTEGSAVFDSDRPIARPKIYIGYTEKNFVRFHSDSRIAVASSMPDYRYFVTTDP